jgi:hypothetical protein
MITFLLMMEMQLNCMLGAHDHYVGCICLRPLWYHLKMSSMPMYIVFTHDLMIWIDDLLSFCLQSLLVGSIAQLCFSIAISVEQE